MKMNNAHIVQGRAGERLIVCLANNGVRFRLENDEGRWWYVDVPPAHARAIAHLINSAFPADGGEEQQVEEIKQEEGDS